jgi:hypothetical protein
MRVSAAAMDAEFSLLMVNVAVVVAVKAVVVFR